MSKLSAHQQASSLSKSLNWNNTILGILAAVTLLAVIGSFLLFSAEPKDVGWKVFRSSRQMGISFEYPSSWQIIKSAGSNVPILIPEDGNSLSVTIYCYAENSDKIIAWLASHEDLISSERVLVKNHDARKIHSQGRGGGERFELLIKDVGCEGKSQTLRLTMFSNQTISPKNRSYFNHMISSFKLTD